MPADVWTADRDDALLVAWRTEIAGAIGGDPADLKRRVLIAGVVLSRRILLDLDALVRVCELREAPEIVRLQVAQCLVGDFAAREN